jgi:alpha-1,3-mannosyl-glycoprotein beta-1,2-N-acetylglucosaminyltransferase
MEKCTMTLLFVIAWGWILVTVAMLAWNRQGPRPGGATMMRARWPASPQSAAAKATPQWKSGGEESSSLSDPFSAADVTTHLQPFSSPLIVFTCQRPNYLKDTLADIYKYRDTTCRIGCPLIISQDGTDAGVTEVVELYTHKFAAVGVPLIHLQHKTTKKRGVNAYQALAAHYGWALGHVFGDELEFTVQGTTRKLVANRVVVLEEDLHIAPDFFNYFAAMAPLLDHDATLLAVSAFNDNGLEGRVSDAGRVLRSDFFPGLGWMMPRHLWKDELSFKWPAGYWDDWLRAPAQRHGRHIVRPEISRTFHFGSKGGASANQFGDKLSKVQLNTQIVDWSQYDVVSSLSPDRFDREYWLLLHDARRVEGVGEAEERVKEGNLRLEYRTMDEFERYAKQFGLMADEKAGVPRTAYKGVVETRLDGVHFLFLTPPMEELQKSFLHAI